MTLDHVVERACVVVERRPPLETERLVESDLDALDVLGRTLKPLNYQNLDALPQFAGVLTTTEFLCRHIFDAMAAAAKSGALGADGAGLDRIRVTLHETDLARASYEGTPA